MKLCNAKPFFLILLFLLFSSSYSLASVMVSVTGNNVNLRSGPGKKYSIEWEYGNGFPLRVISHRGKWVKVIDFERDSGWIDSAFLSHTPHMIVRANKNTNKKINIRSGPSTKNSIVGKAFYGVVFKTLAKKNGWVKVRHESGLVGWIKKTLLWGF